MTPPARRDERLETRQDGLLFPESPRWNAQGLWFVDMAGREVWHMTSRECAPVVAFDDAPSGLGFLEDGSLLVALARSKTIALVRDGSATTHADLQGLDGDFLNDMAVSSSGTAYVDLRRFGADLPSRSGSESLVIISPDGRVHQEVHGLHGPNGIVLAEAEDRLVLAETYGHRLVKFDIDELGGLANPRLHASTGEASPDGICLDAEQAIWVASPHTNDVLRIAPDGEVLDRVACGDVWPTACALGGPSGQTLFITIAHRPPGMTGRDVIGPLGVTTSMRTDELRSAGLYGGILSLGVDVPGYPTKQLL